METGCTIGTLGAFIDERYAPWLRETSGDVSPAQLKADFAAWLSEPLATLSAGHIETWRRDQVGSLGQPQIVSRQLQALDSCLRKAVEWQLMDRNPLQDVSLESDTDYLIELFAGGIGHASLREGWAAVGLDWTWTLGKRAVLVLPAVSDEVDYVLKIHIAGTFRNYPQRLIVTVNETTVGMILCRGPAAYEFFIPARALATHDRTELVLKTPNSLRPIDHDPESTDSRFVGFRVAKIQLQPMSRRPQQKTAALAADDLPGIIAQRAALQEMVSLGFDCEFGFAQRHLGAEPMSLFRWASVPLEKLIVGLEKRFAGLSAREALDVLINPDGEFVVEDKVFGFRYHTFVFATQGGVLERVQRSEYVRVGVLCKTLLQELNEQSKLFVFHDACASKLEDVRRLVRALRIYGDNTLLWIVGAPTAAQIGETRMIEPGLIQGYVSGFEVGLRSAHIPSWVKVACRAHRIWQKSRESKDVGLIEEQMQKPRRQ